MLQELLGQFPETVMLLQVAQVDLWVKLPLLRELPMLLPLGGPPRQAAVSRAAYGYALVTDSNRQLATVTLRPGLQLCARNAPAILTDDRLYYLDGEVIPELTADQLREWSVTTADTIQPIYWQGRLAFGETNAGYFWHHGTQYSPLTNFKIWLSYRLTTQRDTWRGFNFVAADHRRATIVFDNSELYSLHLFGRKLLPYDLLWYSRSHAILPSFMQFIIAERRQPLLLPAAVQAEFQW